LPEMRKDPVTGNWVIIAAERGMRPNDFSLPGKQKNNKNCVFCYGNEDKTPPEVLGWRPPGGQPDTPGWTVRAFPNKFPAVIPEGNPVSGAEGASQFMTAVGSHEVIVDCPDHFDTFGRVSDEQAGLALLAIAERYRALRSDPRTRYIQVFKNYGASAGSSLEHSHWQIISIPVVPDVFVKEFTGTARYLKSNGTCIYCKIISDEIAAKRRIVESTGEFVVLTPYASRFPYEMWILPRKHKFDFSNMSEREIKFLGSLLRRTIRRLERAFNYPPFNIVLHTSPPDKSYDIYHWHIEILPRLSVTAGFEWGTGIFINPASPELASTYLREINPDIRED